MKLASLKFGVIVLASLPCFTVQAQEEVQGQDTEDRSEEVTELGTVTVVGSKEEALVLLK